MRIAINCETKEHGGAHQFTNNLAEFFSDNKHYVTKILNQILI